MDNNKIEIFTDGACRGNPGPGGWGALLRFGSKEKEINLLREELKLTHKAYLSKIKTLTDKLDYMECRYNNLFVQFSKYRKTSHDKEEKLLNNILDAEDEVEKYFNDLIDSFDNLAFKNSCTINSLSSDFNATPHKLFLSIKLSNSSVDTTIVRGTLKFILGNLSIGF